jgi:hypothetical protein
VRTLARELILLAVAAVLSCWLFFGGSASERDSALPHTAPVALSLALAPASAEALPEEAPPASPSLAEPEPLLASQALEEPEVVPEPEAEPEPEVVPEIAPPPPELGTPEGDPDVPHGTPMASPEEQPRVEPEAAPETASATPAENEPAAAGARTLPAEPEPIVAEADGAAPAGPARAASAAELMQDATLLAEARGELASEAPRGFATVFLAAAEDQLDIARAFGEELVLVPKSALDPANPRPRWFRLALEGVPRVELVQGPPPLERYRQYRDFFEYEYARLPAPVRELRRSVLTRSEIYVFGALIPPPEWAVVMARRRAALAATGRELDEVRQFVVRMSRSPDGSFDVGIDEIVFADGVRQRIRPQVSRMNGETQ